MREQNYIVARWTLNFYDTERFNSAFRAPWFKDTTQTFWYKKANREALRWCFGAQGVKNLLRIPETLNPVSHSGEAGLDTDHLEPTQRKCGNREQSVGTSLKAPPPEIQHGYKDGLINPTNPLLPDPWSLAKKGWITHLISAWAIPLTKTAENKNVSFNLYTSPIVSIKKASEP